MHPRNIITVTIETKLSIFTIDGTVIASRLFEYTVTILRTTK
ncbi:hypothetical protein C3B79_2607 [Aeromonas hydrophila]|nr:hypothetical protein C3B79_2607 [Aeromonas hydrophila]